MNLSPVLVHKIWDLRGSLRRFDWPYCDRGWHIPVKAISDTGFEVFCQQCMEPLSEEYWLKFFNKSHNEQR